MSDQQEQSEIVVSLPESSMPRDERHSQVNNESDTDHNIVDNEGSYLSQMTQEQQSGQSEIVFAKSGTSSDVYSAPQYDHYSEPATLGSDIIIKSDWLAKTITNRLITVKGVPFLLSIIGLPESKQSTLTNCLLHLLNCRSNAPSNQQGFYFYETAAVRTLSDNCKEKELVYSKTFNYISVMESAIKHHLYLKGKLIRHIEIPILHTPFFNDDDLNSHFNKMTEDFYRSKVSTERNRKWDEGLPSGIAMINIWSIGSSKAASYILPLLSGHLYNNYVWTMFDLIRDVPNLHKAPVTTAKATKESRPRLHSLLRSACLSACQDSNRTNTCKLISYHDTSFSQSEISIKLKQFQKDADSAATQMHLKNLIDLNNILMLCTESEEECLKKAFDDIVHRELNRSFEIPLPYIFLRSYFFDSGNLYVTKEKLQEKGGMLGMQKEDCVEFCRLFTSSGSLIDVSLIDEHSNIIILRPVDFFHELDKLFHPSPNVDSLVSKYGIVTEPIAHGLFKDHANVMMEVLISFGIGAKLKSSQVNCALPAPNNIIYYVPNASTAEPDYNCQPNALHLLRDIDRPMSHSKVAFTSKFLKLCASSKLELPDKPVRNIATFKVFSSDVLNHVFDFVYIGDAIEFRFSSLCDEEELKQTCKNILTVCHEIMPNTTKYNFAVMCSADADPTLADKLKRQRHLLPNTKLCPACQNEGLHKTPLLKIWNEILKEEKYKVPIKKRLNGDPLTMEETFLVVKGLENLSEETLQVVAQCLDMPGFFSLTKTKWRKCMEMIQDWEDFRSLDEKEKQKQEASRKLLAIKLMDASIKIYKENESESEALENVASSLNYEVAIYMRDKKLLKVKNDVS